MTISAEPVGFAKAYYIKLGRKGLWEKDSIERGVLRFGWKRQNLNDILHCRWDVIKAELVNEFDGKMSGSVTSDLNALKRLAMTGPDDLWITFHQSKLWWTRLPVGSVEQDEVSKFRRSAQPWSDETYEGRKLITTELPGKIEKIQGYRATVCRVHEVDLLKRVLNGTASALAGIIEKQHSVLSSLMGEAIRQLHWRDFEILVDLIFRDAGWIRTSVLGKSSKGYDFILEEPILRERYAVQVKSSAGRKELEQTHKEFSPKDFRRIFFVVHEPAADLLSGLKLPDNVELILTDRLGAMAVDAGLVKWLQDKMF